LIDEAHFLTDKDRGPHLYQLITEAELLGLNILLVTATRNFRKIKGFDVIILPPRQKPPKKISIEYEDYLKKMEAGLPTIHFVKKKYNVKHRVDEFTERGVKCAGITGDTPPAERLEIQLAYRRGDISCVVTTNVLAQGINMPCENIFIEYNRRD